MVPAKKAAGFTPSKMKVVRPREHTMKMSVTTKATTTMTQAPVMSLPFCSTDRLDVGCVARFSADKDGPFY